MRILLALAPVLSLAAEAVVPQPQPPAAMTPEEQRASRKMFFERMDANKDGRVELPEIQAYYTTPVAGDRSLDLFKRLDADSSGQLSPEEFAVLANVLVISRPPVNNAMKAQDSLRRWDGNGDGVISLDEFETASVRSTPGPRPIVTPTQPRPEPKPEQ